MICPHCGVSNSDKARKCYVCGNKLSEQLPYSTSQNQIPARSKHTFIKVISVIVILIVALFLAQMAMVFLFDGQSLLPQAKSTIDVEVYITPYSQDYTYNFTLFVNEIEEASGYVSYGSPAHIRLTVEFPRESSGGYPVEVRLNLTGNSAPWGSSTSYLTLVNGEEYIVSFPI